MGYVSLAHAQQDHAPTGWWNYIYKIMVPPKAIYSSWLALNNRIQTWDNLERKGKIGPNKCPICRT